MRICSALLTFVAATSLVACQSTAESLESSEQSILGGDNFASAFESVCAMLVTRPPDDEGAAQDPIYCTCAKVAPQIVMTSATCVQENLAANTLGDVDVRFGADFSSGAAFVVDEIVIDRYYDVEKPAVRDIALLHLTTDPTEAVLRLNERELTDDDRGPSAAADCSQDINNMTPGCVVLVGYGETDNNVEDFGARRKTIVPLRSVDRRSISAGTGSQTTCRGDSGGPVLMDLGSGFEIVAVTSRHRNSCFDGVSRSRVDVLLDAFIYPYIDRFGATCGLQMDSAQCDTSCPRTPDPDCDDCSENGVCKEDCPTRDRDCELGVFPGSACTKDGDCELGGRCVAAADDATFMYCTMPCDPAIERQCPGATRIGAEPMACETDGGVSECRWTSPSPGSQGFSCATNADCRSGICEETICVNECDPAAADSCPENVADPTTPFVCSPSSVAPGKNVCLGVIFSGGGGFCALGTATTNTANAASGSRGRGALLLLGFVMIALITRRSAGQR